MRGLPSARLLLLLAGVTGCASGPTFVRPTTAPGFFVAGYHAYWAGEAWRDYPHDLLDELYFFELEADGDGGFLDDHGWPSAWRAMVDSALAAGVQVTPTVSMHDPAAFARLFTDSVATARLVDNVVGLVRGTPGLAGVQLDFEVFEPVPAEARDGYTAFARALRTALLDIDERLALSVFVLAFDDADAFDEIALAHAADYVVVQGYDYHSIGSPNAGPVAAVSGWGRLNWETVVDRFLDEGVPARKLVMAVPLYGYQWPVTSDLAGAEARGPAVAIPLTAPDDVLPELPRAFSMARAHGARRDAASASPYYVFLDEDGWQQGWFEDARSLRAKYDFVKRRGLGGIAIFPLAYGTEDLWSDVARAFSGPRRRP